MALVELLMPKMGESIMEATILKWVKNVGDAVEADETILEIATDKVDTEVPSPVSGTISEIKYQENDVVPIGKIIAVIATEAESKDPKPTPSMEKAPANAPPSNGNGHAPQQEEIQPRELAVAETGESYSGGQRFYSPLVKNIAKEENIGLAELEQVEGTGAQGRVTKKDMLYYLENRQTPTFHPSTLPPLNPQPETRTPQTSKTQTPVGENTEIIEMDRMRRLIADHMVLSKHTSPHVTSFVEVDVTNLVQWRERVKDEFQKRHNEKITFTPLFVEAVVKAIQDFPMVNISVEGNQIIRKKYINIGMAAALPSGNLIVPVIKNADLLNLTGLTKTVNDLANRARNNKLKPEEIQDGTFTITNVGTFGNLMGTPIINQPQAAILATGAIRKKPAVVETQYGDVIAIRQMMFLSLSYDHRVVDGALGGSFLRRIGDYLEAFDANRSV